MAERYNTDWTGIPRTDPKAVPIFKNVKNAHVVYVAKATIRNAVVEGGHFVVANGEPNYTTRGKAERIEVECLWYGCKPPSSWMNLTYLTDPIEKHNYTGQVVKDLGRAVEGQ